LIALVKLKLPAASDWLVSSRVRMARRQEGRVHTGQRDEFGQKFFRARHGRRMSQANALCHFLLDTGFLRCDGEIKKSTK
jgi:hypothetical protein